MLDKIPDREEMTTLVGKSLYEIWNKLCVLIEEKYDIKANIPIININSEKIANINKEIKQYFTTKFLTIF